MNAENGATGALLERDAAGAVAEGEGDTALGVHYSHRSMHGHASLCALCAKRAP